MKGPPFTQLKIEYEQLTDAINFAAQYYSKLFLQKQLFELKSFLKKLVYKMSSNRFKKF